MILLVILFAAVMFETSQSQFQVGFGASCSHSNIQCFSHLNCSRTLHLCDCPDGQFLTRSGVCHGPRGEPGADCDLSMFDSRQCVQNAHCNASKKCECIPGYHYDGTVCVPHLLKHNDNCTSSWGVQCQPEAFCNTTTNKCQCHAPYFPTTNNLCIKRLSPHSVCSRSIHNPLQCVDNAECVRVSNTTEYVCLCKAKYFSRGSHCSPVVTAGGVCDAKLNEPMQCTNNSHCEKHNQTCLCNPGFARRGDECHLELRPLEKCNHNMKDSFCMDTTHCDGHMCVCDSGLFLNIRNGTCMNVSGVNRRCDVHIETSDQCPSNSKCNKDSHGQGQYICQCVAEYFFNGTDCITRVKPGENCTKPDQCVEHADCEQNVCQCRDGYFIKDDICFRKKLPFENCLRSDQCVGNATCDQTLNKCVCDDGFFPNITTETCDKVTLGYCSSEYSKKTHIEECPVHAHCINNKCQCESGYIDDSSNNCISVSGPKLFGEECGQGSYCVDHAICTAVVNGTLPENICLCQPNYFSLVGKCKPRLHVGEDCINNLPDPLQCEEGAACKRNPVNYAFQCTCTESYFYHNQTCKPRQPAGGVCNDSLIVVGNQCFDHAQCKNTTCVCDQDYYKNNGTCLQQKVLGEHCDTHIQTHCKGPYTECDHDSHTCVCENGYFININTCTKRPALGEDCSDPHHCTMNAFCNLARQCECEEHFFEHLGKCTPRVPVDDLCDQHVANTKQCDDDHAHCVNTTTRYVCQCDSQYQKLQNHAGCTPIV